MAIRSLEQIDLARRVFVRADLDVPVRDGVIQDDTRIRASLPTLRRIVSAGGSAVVAAHLGRPRVREDPALSLAPVAARLRELLKVAVDLAPHAVGHEVSARAARLPACSVLLLENVRFHPEEMHNVPDFSRELASLAEAYVNDAFAVCHRAHASVVGVPAYFAPEDRAAGELLGREVAAFDRALGSPDHPFVVVLGGAGLRDKLGMIRNLLPRADTLVLGGATAHPFLGARGVSVGESPVEEGAVGLAEELLAEAASRGASVLLPVDHVIATGREAGAATRTTDDATVPAGWQALDAGPKTLAAWRAAISEARTVLWNGPVGAAEIDDFARGTFVLAEAVAECPGFTVALGEDTTRTVRHSGFSHRIDHISTGGGAPLALLEGEILPGLAALEV